MPRKTKESNEIVIEKPVKSSKKVSSASAKSKAPAKKASSKVATAKSSIAKKTSSKASTATKKTSVKSKKTTSSKKVNNLKTTTTVAKANKKSTSTKVANSKKEKESKITPKSPIIEYYDLPYRYNKTIVKVLAQTPTTLFVYWDISDEDKANYVKQYGDYFFYDTKPVLVVHNSTMNYSYEIDINDYANSWYIHVPDANCDYEIELGRRPINEYSKINDYLEITSSNDIVSPNDHILFEELTNNVYFRNLKTNVTTRKDISVSFLTKIGKIYNVQDFYENLYKDEVFSFDKINFKNLPSS